MGLTTWGLVISALGFILLLINGFIGFIIIILGFLVSTLGLVAKGATAVVHTVNQSITTKTCPYCRNRMPVDAIICLACGREISDISKKINYRERSNKVNILTESKLIKLESELDETIKLLDNLRKKMVLGEISEETYIDLKNNFEDKIIKLNREISHTNSRD
jgi:hypothetical protein